MIPMDRHKETFREEAYELLADLEAVLLELEQRPDDGELIDRAFRDLHTIKGSGSMFGFQSIAAFTHEVETVFDLVRNSEMAVTKGLIDLTLSARDHIRMLLDGREADSEAEGKDILTAFRKLIPGNSAEANPALLSAKDNSPEPHDPSDRATYRIQFHPNHDIFTKGINPLLLLDELHALGDCKVLAYTDAIPHLKDINPEACYTYWDVILTTDKDINTVKDVFIFIEDDCKLTIDVIGDSERFHEEFSSKKVGEILLDRGFVTRDDLNRVLKRQKRIGEMLVDEKIIDGRKVEAALIEQQRLKEIKGVGESRQSDTASSIRVASDRLDRLVDLVGELVTVKARLTQTALSKKDSELVMIAEEVERLTEELRDNTMSARLVPIGALFSKFKRLVRDLSKETGKEVGMSTDGAETELDKTVIERINDPLVHLIRNSIDHGIEPPDVRRTKGKTQQGTVHLSARHSGANVLIEIADDGAGLDPDAIRAKAFEKGLIQADAEISDQEIFNLIFAAGLSTAKEITNVSGRGVGMDVVKRSIEALRGAIDISSRKGQGTTITLKLPLTMAIIEGLLVMIDKEYFVLPLSTVEECIELKREGIALTHGRHIANVRGEIVPYIRLREQFMINGDRPEIEQVVVTGIEGKRVGFVVDSVIGEHQTVIKSLGRFYRNIEGVSGATILGDGTVALILDVQKLLQAAELEEVLA